MRRLYKKVFIVFISLILFNFNIVSAKNISNDDLNLKIKKLLTDFFDLGESKTPVDVSNLVNDPKLAELYNLEFNSLIEFNKEEENINLVVNINSITERNLNSYIVKFEILEDFNYVGRKNKSSSREYYTCEIQQLNNKFYINKLFENVYYAEYISKGKLLANGNRYLENDNTLFENYSNYLNKKLESRKKFELKKDYIMKKLKTQKEDKNYKNKSSNYSGYDWQSAVDYAHMYWKNYNPGYVAFDTDCQNFVSQAVHAGGVPMNEYWHHYVSKYYTYDVTHSWSVVQDFYTYIKNNGYTWGDDYYYNWRLGDVVQIFKPDMAHSVILTGVGENGEALYSAHTIDRIDYSLAKAIDKLGEDVSWRYIKFWH